MRRQFPSGRELAEDETPTRLAYSRNFPEYRCRIFDEAKNGDRRHDLELFSGKLKPFGTRNLKADVRTLPRSPPLRGRNHCSGGVNADHDRTSFREFERGVSIAAAHV